MAFDKENQDSSTRSSKHYNSKRVTYTKYDLFMVIGCLIYICVAMISFYGVRNHICGTKTNNSLDSIYFTIVLMTSAGYKDLQPHRTLAILLATFFALTGIVVFGVLMSLGADNILATQMGEHEFLESVLKNKTVHYPSRLKKKWKVLMVMLAIHLILGMPVLIFIGDMHFSQALRCVSSTFTTVLSDEKCFSTKVRRIFAIFWILFGVFTLSGLMYIVTETYHHRRKWLVGKKDDKLVDMLPSDLDKDGMLSITGFLERIARRAERLDREGKRIDIKETDFDIHQASWKKYLSKYLKINSDDLWNMAIIFVIYLGSSTVIFYAARYHISRKIKTNDILDTVYFAFVIMTSVGYGDLSPDDALAFTFATIFSIWGMYVLGVLLHMALEALHDQQQHITRENWSSGMDQNAKKLITKNGKIIGLSLLGILLFETVILILIEDLNFIHALYCVSITITSAGTEKCFSTKLGRSFAIFMMIVGALYKYYILLTITNVYIEIKQRSEKERMKEVVSVGPPKPQSPPEKKKKDEKKDGKKDDKKDDKKDEEKKKKEVDYRYGEEVPMLMRDLIDKGVLQYKDIEALKTKFRKLAPPGTNRLTLREIMAS